MTVKVVTPNTSSPQDLRDLLKQGMADKDIEFLLQQQYKDEFLVNNLMSEVKKLRNSQKTASGLIFILVGAAVMLLSCMLTLMGNYSSTNFGLVLYGLTSLGIIIVFIGLIRIFS